MRRAANAAADALLAADADSGSVGFRGRGSGVAAAEQLPANDIASSASTQGARHANQRQKGSFQAAAWSSSRREEAASSRAEPDSKRQVGGDWPDALGSLENDENLTLEQLEARIQELHSSLAGKEQRGSSGWAPALHGHRSLQDRGQDDVMQGDEEGWRSAASRHSSAAAAEGAGRASRGQGGWRGDEVDDMHGEDMAAAMGVAHALGSCLWLKDRGAHRDGSRTALPALPQRCAVAAAGAAQSAGAFPAQRLLLLCSACLLLSRLN
jgi:hypothetical protein